MSPQPLVLPDLDKAQLAQSPEAWFEIPYDVEWTILVRFGAEAAEE
jgi:hypothetical protein